MMKCVTSLGGIFFKCKDPDKVKEWYSKLISNEKLFTEIYLKSIKNRISFSKQLLLDYIWCLENNKKNSILATEIKQQFFL